MGGKHPAGLQPAPRRAGVAASQKGDTEQTHQRSLRMRAPPSLGEKSDLGRLPADRRRGFRTKRAGP